MKVRLVADPPWGHWHEQYATLLEREVTTWIACTHANLEHHPTEALYRFTWNMPVSMSVVYSPWKPSILEAAIAAKEAYETKVKPFGTPEP